MTLSRAAGAPGRWGGPAFPLAALLAVLVGLLGPPSAAITWSVAWVDQFGSPAPELGTYAVDSFGGDVFTGGLTYGALPGQASEGDADGWIRRTDARGSEVWTVQFGTRRWEEVGAARADASGLYVDGATTGSLPGQTSAGGADAFVARYDLEGNERWMAQFGTDEDDYAAGIVVDRSGVFVFGYTFGAFANRVNHGSADLFLARFDKRGAMEWLRQFGGRGYEEAWAAMIAPQGIYVNGFTDGHLPGARSHGDLDAFLALFSRDGRRLWLRQFGTNRADIGSGLAADASGVYVSGQTWGSFRGFERRGRSDAFIRGFSPAGVGLWTRQFGTRAVDASAGATLVRGDVVTVGTTGGAFHGQTNLGGDDVFARVFDSTTGDAQWTLEFGTDEEETVGWGWGAAGDLFVIGDTSGTFAGESNAGSFDSYLARVDLASIVEHSARGE